jgi:hypothetical protein
MLLHEGEGLLGRETRQMVAFWMQVWPKEWKRGRVARATSPSGGVGMSFGTTTAQFSKRFEWLSSAPLGLPVVPEV